MPPRPTVHCGLAVAMRGGGLIAPAILDAGRHGPRRDHGGDARHRCPHPHRAACATARSRKARSPFRALGETGVDALFGVIYPPQVALVGFGTPRLRPMVRDGRVEPRLAVTVTPCRRPPGKRRPPWRAVSRRDRPPFAGARDTMTQDDIRAAFLADLTAVAPDLDPATSDDDDHLQDDLGLDSMDFLNLVSALAQTLRPADPRDGLPEAGDPGQGRGLSAGGAGGLTFAPHREKSREGGNEGKAIDPNCYPAAAFPF